MRLCRDKEIQSSLSSSKNSLKNIASCGTAISYNCVASLQSTEDIIHFLEERGFTIFDKPPSPCAACCTSPPPPPPPSPIQASQHLPPSTHNDHVSEYEISHDEEEDASETTNQEKEDGASETVILMEEEDGGATGTVSLVEEEEEDGCATGTVSLVEEEEEDGCATGTVSLVEEEEGSSDTVSLEEEEECTTGTVNRLSLTESSNENVDAERFFHSTPSTTCVPPTSLSSSPTCTERASSSSPPPKTFRRLCPRDSAETGSTGGERYTSLSQKTPTPSDCRAVLRVAKSMFLKCINQARANSATSCQQTEIVQYLECLLVLKHLQRPGVVQNMTVAEWQGRMYHDYEGENLCVIGVRTHKTSTQQVAAFALDKDEESWFRAYYEKVRPSLANSDTDHPKAKFFLSSFGTERQSVSRDIKRYQLKYKLPDISSQVVRKVCETWTLAKYTDPEKSLFAKYLAHTNATAERHYREKVLDDICHGYKLVRRSGGCEESQTPDAAAPQMELNVVEREMECLSEPQDSSSSDGQ
ncbi:uncharacterized protein LOC122925856 [Bufo gargarizans]|uniref:uncharacterized protein LOC122925856 n=1 Tax=Bufo gargarizans TaxID=30331 RepID=UPI001CF11F95|nr:uncharacterized protein LOC122925856 [Bufo gargarizans]